MWEKVDKTKLIQYKLKVELGPDVTKLIQTLNETGAMAPQALDQSGKTELFQSVKANIADSMLNLDSRTQKAEESKEKPDISRFQGKAGSLQGPRYGAPQNFGGVKPSMEDIKEQDTESEMAHKDTKQPAAPSGGDGVPIARKISEA